MFYVYSFSLTLAQMSASLVCTPELVTDPFRRLPGIRTISFHVHTFVATPLWLHSDLGTIEPMPYFFSPLLFGPGSLVCSCLFTSLSAYLNMCPQEYKQKERDQHKLSIPSFSLFHCFHNNFFDVFVRATTPNLVTVWSAKSRPPLQGVARDAGYKPLLLDSVSRRIRLSLRSSHYRT